jgi:hypothetical protein
MAVKPNKSVPQVAKTETKQQLPAAPPQLPVTSDDALDRHLSEWGGRGGRLIAFNGATGIHRTLDDDVEVPSGSEFVAFLHDTQKGFIRFNSGAARLTHGFHQRKRRRAGARDAGRSR